LSDIVPLGQDDRWLVKQY